MKDPHHPFFHIAAFGKKHLAARIALGFLLALFLLVAVLHPRGVKTFLIMGIDNYGSLNDNGRSDVMMLVQVDFSDLAITAVTFARDMFIQGPRGETKINTIVRSYDEGALTQALEDNFGLQIDGWFRVNFTSVILLVDALGGAEVELTAEEARYIDRSIGAYPDNPLSEGVCRLNGAQALCYARCRSLDNDMGRGQRQNRLLAALVKQTKAVSIPQILDVFRSLGDLWQSSFSAAEQAKLLGSALWLRGAQVTQIGMPFSGEWRYGNNTKGENGVLIDLDANRRLLQEALGLSEPKTGDSSDP